MNWKIILQLSVFGLIMAFATVSLIPERIEPAFWLVIFIFCAWVIAKVCIRRYFLHGFMVSIFNCVWITVVHIWFCSTYMASHPQQSAMMTGVHPRRMMLEFGPVVGIVCGLILGLFSLIASKIVKKGS